MNQQSQRLKSTAIFYQSRLLRSLALLLWLTLLPLHTFCQSKHVVQSDTLLTQELYSAFISVADSLLQTESSMYDLFFLNTKKGDAYYYLGDIQNSLQAYLAAIDRPDLIFDSDRKLHLLYQQTLNYIGFCYSEIGLNEKALEYYLLSQQQAVALKDSTEIAMVNYNIALTNLKQGSFEIGMDYLLKVYQMDVQRKDTSSIGFDLNALGVAELEFGNAKEAISYFKESINLLEKSSGNYNSLATRLNNISGAYLELGFYDSAMIYNTKAIEIVAANRDSITLAKRWIDRATIFNGLNEPYKAIKEIEKALPLVTPIEESALMLTAKNALIEAYNKQGNSQKALLIAQENISYATEFGSLLELKMAYENYAHLLHSSKNSATAFDMLLQARSIDDSIKSNEARKLKEQLAIRYDLDRIQSEKKMLALKNEVAVAALEKKEITTRWLFAIISILLLASGIIIYNQFTKNKLRQELLISEINALRLQIKQLISYDPSSSSITIDEVNKSLLEPLSEREFEILQEAMSEKNNKEIADAVYVSVNTVKFHLKNIYAKLGVSNRKEALKFAFQASNS